VRVYAGIDPVTKRRHDLTEVVPAGPRAATLAEQTLTRLLNQVDEKRNPRTVSTVNQLLDQHLAMLDVDRSTLLNYQGQLRLHVRPFIGGEKVGAIDAAVLDSLYAELRRCRAHCRNPRGMDHRTDRPHECDNRCGPHVCRPLSASSIRQIHHILSGSFKRAVRWRWVGVNPMTQAEPPRAPKPNPQPPSAAEAAKIVNEAWRRDPDWGVLIWLALTTGARHGELCGLRWTHVDVVGAVLTLRRSIAQHGGEIWEKDTKTHQQRRVVLDPETVEVLTEHWERHAARAAAMWPGHLRQTCAGAPGGAVAERISRPVPASTVLPIDAGPVSCQGLGEVVDPSIDVVADQAHPVDAVDPPFGGFVGVPSSRQECRPPLRPAPRVRGR
jgi:integrase